VHRRPESLLEQHWNFGCRNCDGNVNDWRVTSSRARSASILLDLEV
jgi:hypothetical protein